MTPQEQIENELKAITHSWRDNPEMIKGYRLGYMDGGLKGMEIQKEIDQQEIKDLKWALWQMTAHAFGETVLPKDFDKAMDICKKFKS